VRDGLIPNLFLEGQNQDLYLEGTRFGIKVDPRDGLLSQGAEGYALTWMDAKVGDWVVTPRRGKAVEINALWYNALRLLADWLREAHDPEADEFAAHPDKSHDSFNRRFWHAAGGYLCDVVDGENGDDTAFRPNQIFAIALDHPVLDREYWEPVVTAVHAKLVTRSGCALWRRASPSTNRAISAMCVRAMLPITRARYGPG
jgi:predicted glycogen debranching enzyme